MTMILAVTGISYVVARAWHDMLISQVINVHHTNVVLRYICISQVHLSTFSTKAR